MIAFGGPAAHIALMEREAVERRAWVTRERFLDLIGACNLLPGPSSTQVAMALGYSRAGWLGLTVAGVCFIVPASAATLVLAWAYVHYGSLPQVAGLLYGAKPVMLAIIAQAVWRLGRMALRTWVLSAAGIACFAAALAGAPPFAILLVCGGVFAILTAGPRLRQSAARCLIVAPAAAGTAAAGAAGSPALLSIVLVFLKLGVVVFGSGYVLLAFLQTDLVEHRHWITQTQLLDAVTAGQVTPGPVFATATFLGYLLHGYAGAAVATAAIFLPSFVMAGVVGALANHVRRSKPAAAFLNGVNAAAVALMAAVAITLGRGALVDGWTWALGLVSAVLLLRFKVNATWLILAGAVLGILLRMWV
jgi:chromate transporter